MTRPLLNTAKLGALCLAALVLGGAVPFPSDSPVASAIELFPAAKGLNVQRGFAVATDGDWLAVGAPLDDTNGPMNAGAVFLFEWSVGLGSWRPAGELHADHPVEGARFGSALAMEGATLAVTAIGEGSGRVYVFRRTEGVWSQEATLSGADGTRFGTALAIDEGRLAVGSVSPDGRSLGSVYVFTPELDLDKRVGPDSPQDGERFGAAVSLRGEVLAVGAPSHGGGTGAVYVFTQADAWKQRAILTVPNASANAQLGFSVGVVAGSVLAGAPAEASNGGAVYFFRRSGLDDWNPTPVPVGAETQSREQFGAAMAACGDLLAVAAPFGVTQAGKTGAVLVFRYQNGSLAPIGSTDPDNTESLDLGGLAVAVSGHRVVTGAVLGDQGGGGAGAAWSFSCQASCHEEAEAVVTERKVGDRFGVAMAVDPVGDRIAVASARDGESGPTGSVSVFRRAGQGWRQEDLINDPAHGSSSGFGTAVALEGDTLVIGAPLDDAPSGVSPPAPTPGTGRVHVYRRGTTSWVSEATLQAPQPQRNDSFGAAVALAGDFLAVGAPSSDVAGINSGAVYLFERSPDGGWREPVVITAGDAQKGDQFGASVALHGDTLAIGAPRVGAVYVTERLTSWQRPVRLVAAEEGPDRVPSDLGTSVSLGDGWLVAGRPGAGGGAIDLFTGSGTSWSLAQTIESDSLPGLRFGASVSLFGKCLAVGRPGGSVAQQDLNSGGAFLYERNGLSWEFKSEVRALRRLQSNEFGSLVGAGPGFFVASSPVPPGGDRVTLYTLRDPRACSE